MDKSVTLGERLASVETTVDAIQADVQDIKRDVRNLLSRDSAREGVAIFVRGLVPFFAVGVSLAALILSMNGG
jgi:hypothetical protein